MVDDEVPKSFASVIGHVCGVIAVGMTALSLFGVWALVHKPSGPALLAVSISVALSWLMLRWAGALTGYWDTRGRLAVPKFVYSIFAALFVAFAVVCAALAVAKPPTTVGEGLVTFVGVSCGIALAYLCYLTYRRFK